MHAAPDPAKPWQGSLFEFAHERRHGRGTRPDPERLPVLAANHHLMEAARVQPALLLVPEQLKQSGLTWESALSMAGDQLDKAALWESLIPAMGYMALLRNLRGFDEAGVSDEVAERVADRLKTPEEVAKSKQLPFRFLSAYRAVSSLRWAWPLEQALNHALGNVPSLPGRTLVLVDRSPSMWGQKLSEHSAMDWAEAAAVFGAALAARAEKADLVEFGMKSRAIPFKRGESVLKIVDRFTKINQTDIPAAVAAHLRPHHDRVVIITDEQTRPGWLPSNSAWCGGGPEAQIDDLVPAKTPLYMWNFAGYTHGAAPAGLGNRHTMGGLSDAAFRMIPLLESGRDAAWPWQS